ncbi:MAG TPA: MoxR family ATPase [Anaerolineae bacterium]|nr:MoxR family ATPase [Anaerolineae bacterium]
MDIVKEFAEKIIHNIESVIVGKREAVELAVIGLLCQGHILIDDVPGLGKTMLARSIATSMGCSFGRIQFTPDMLPSDVTGVTIYNQAKQEFIFRPGPVMSGVVLADEINRATPKTQSALLEAMQERQVTVDGITYPLSPVFMVIATENPIEYQGTYALPEAQLDRFLMRIKLGYPDRENEIDVMDRQQYNHPIDKLESVSSVEEVLRMQNEIKKVHISTPLKEYIVDLVRQTRDHPDVYLGASPRGSLGLYRSIQARAALEGRDYSVPDDARELAVPVLGHRLILAPGAHLRDLDEKRVLEEVLSRVTVPAGAASEP